MSVVSASSSASCSPSFPNVININENNFTNNPNTWALNVSPAGISVTQLNDFYDDCVVFQKCTSNYLGNEEVRDYSSEKEDFSSGNGFYAFSLVLERVTSWNLSAIFIRDFSSGECTFTQTGDYSSVETLYEGAFPTSMDSVNKTAEMSSNPVSRTRVDTGTASSSSYRDFDVTRVQTNYNYNVQQTGPNSNDLDYVLQGSSSSTSSLTKSVIVGSINDNSVANTPPDETVSGLLAVNANPDSVNISINTTFERDEDVITEGLVRYNVFNNMPRPSPRDGNFTHTVYTSSETWSDAIYQIHTPIVANYPSRFVATFKMEGLDLSTNTTTDLGDINYTYRNILRDTTSNKWVLPDLVVGVNAAAFICPKTIRWRVNCFDEGEFNVGKYNV